MNAPFLFLPSAYARTADRHRRVIFEGERAARALAQFAPAFAVESYVADCRDAATAFRWRAEGINAITMFVPFGLSLSVGGSPGAAAAFLFLSLWASCGLWRCMAENSRMYAQCQIAAVDRLTNAAVEAQGENRT